MAGDGTTVQRHSNVLGNEQLLVHQLPAAQGGEFTWRYSLTATPGKFDRDTATTFARTVRQPLAAVVQKQK